MNAEHEFVCDETTLPRMRRVVIRTSFGGAMVQVALFGSVLLVAAGIVWTSWALVVAGVAFPLILLWRLWSLTTRHLTDLAASGRRLSSRASPGVLTVETPRGRLEMRYDVLGAPRRVDECVVWRQGGAVTVLPEALYPASDERLVASGEPDEAAAGEWLREVPWTRGARRDLLRGVRRLVLLRPRQLAVFGVLLAGLLVALLTRAWPWAALLGAATVVVLLLAWVLVGRVGRSLPASGSAYAVRVEAAQLVIRTPVSTLATPYAEIDGVERRTGVILLTRRGSNGSFVFPDPLLTDDDLDDIRAHLVS